MQLENLLAVSVLAFAAPLVAVLSGRLRIPAVVLEIVLGIVAGPSVLGWVHVDTPVDVLATLGLAILLFLAGLEVALGRLRGPLVRIVGSAMLLSLAGCASRNEPPPYAAVAPVEDDVWAGLKAAPDSEPSMPDNDVEPVAAWLADSVSA